MATIGENLPSTMRACQWTSNAGGIEHNLQLTDDAPLPNSATSLRQGHSLVRVAYTTLNPFDYKVAEMPIVGQRLLSKPSIPCLDFSGVVVSTRNLNVKPGDAVHGRTNPPAFGCLAEYVVVGSEGISKIPKNVNMRDAAALGIAALAAYQCIEPYVRAGSRMFINGGSGGTGTFGIQIAKALGCSVVTTCSGGNAALCRELGADVVIDYQNEDVIVRLAELSRDGKFDLVVDNVWTDGGLYWQSYRFLKPNGHFVSPGGTKLVQIRDLALGRLLPSWLGGGRSNFVFVRCEPIPEHLSQLTQWAQSGTVKVIVEQEYEMADAAKAFERLKTGRVRGKLVVRVADVS